MRQKFQNAPELAGQELVVGGKLRKTRPRHRQNVPGDLFSVIAKKSATLTAGSPAAGTATGGSNYLIGFGT